MYNNEYGDYSPIKNPKPSQNPIPRSRSDAFAHAIRRSAHSGTTHVTGNDGRAIQRGYTQDQIDQTYKWGRERPDPKGAPGVSVFELGSIDTPGTKRGVVAHIPSMQEITVNPRVPVSPVSSRKPPKKSNTKSAQDAQLAKKRQRSKEAYGG